MLYLTNAFSINMLPREGHDLAFRPITIKAAKTLLQGHEFTCAIGHEDTARVVSRVLSVDLKVARINVEMRSMQDTLLVAQYRGPRLEVGATELPEGATLEFWQVYHHCTGQVSKVSIVQESEMMQNVVGLKLGRIG